MINLKLYLIKNKISQTTLSELIGVCIPKINLVLNGHRKFSYTEIGNIAKVLELCPDKLLNDVIKSKAPNKSN